MDIHLGPFSKQRLEVPSCAGALASPSTRRGSSSPSAPSRRAWGGKTARSFRSAASRCASVDFTTFPLSALGAMAEVVEEVDGVGGAGGDGGRGAAVFQLWEDEGAAKISEIGVATGEWANYPCFPCL